MKWLGNAPYRRFSLYLFLTVSALLLLSCSRSSPSLEFANKLSQIDQLLVLGNKAQALKKLVSLRALASSSSQWLSIAKRERSLGEYSSASTTLRKALVQLPANKDLCAVLMDTLIELNMFQEASILGSSLSDAAYSALVSYVEIQKASATDPFLIDPLFWTKAYDAVGTSTFLKNASVLYAFNGQIPFASTLQPVSADSLPLNSADAYFYALLCYDASLYEQVFTYLGESSVGERSFKELSLMADTASKQSSLVLASSLYQSCVDLFPTESPLPYYNLAVSAENALDERMYLENGLAMFPQYYPLIVRYVRSAVFENKKEQSDPVRADLEHSGFQSFDMEEKIRNTPQDEKKAAAVLKNALSLSGTNPNPLVVIEQFRFNQLTHPDTIRSASEMWNLLEKSPSDPSIHAYGVWYFASIRNFDACFALNRGATDSAGSFYTGLEAVFAGDLTRGEESFKRVANSERNAWCALANIALIHKKTHEYTTAVEELSTAAQLAPDNRLKSSLLYEAARILLDLRDTERATHLLGYALELDPSNYLASLLLRETEAGK